MRTLGRYTLQRRLGTGGMGEVFLAEQLGPAGFAKTVVVKRLLPHLASDQAFVDLFLNEARLAARLCDPNIVQVFELGHDQDAYFIAMEYVSGRSLRALSRRADQLAPAIAARICADVLRGLSHAHEFKDGTRCLEIVHRDISPDNVLVSFSGLVKIVDFGVAKAAKSASLTRPGMLKGKYRYMAPEQIRGDSLDARADLYAVGAVLYELLTGRPPFEAESEAALLFRIVSEPAPDVRASRPDVPDELAEIVAKSLAGVQDRYASAREMSRALETFLQASGALVGTDQLSELMNQLFSPTDANEPEPAATTKKLLPSDARRTPASSRSAKKWLAAILVIATVVVSGMWIVIARLQGQTPAASQSSVVAFDPARSMAAAVATEASTHSVAEPSAPTLPSSPTVSVTAPASHAAPTRPSAHMAPGKLTIYSKPWAEVFWSGRSIGTTPIVNPIELPPGLHVLNLRNTDLHLARTVSVRIRSGRTTTLKLSLLDP